MRSEIPTTTEEWKSSGRPVPALELMVQVFQMLSEPRNAHFNQLNLHLELKVPCTYYHKN